MSHEVNAESRKFLVPHLTESADVSTCTHQQLRQNVFSRQLPEVRAYSLGKLIRDSGLISSSVDCAACLLVSENSKLRGTVIATLFASIKAGVPIPDLDDVALLIELLRSESCSLLRPWALALRHKLSDPTAVEEAATILSERDSDPPFHADARKSRRALMGMCRRIVANENVEMFVF